MARAYASAKIPPPRNVYFASVTAEEQGLLGSKYLGMHPPEPIRDLTLNLNFDELLPVEYLGRLRSEALSAPASTPW